MLAHLSLNMYSDNNNQAYGSKASLTKPVGLKVIID